MTDVMRHLVEDVDNDKFTFAQFTAVQGFVETYPNTILEPTLERFELYLDYLKYVDELLFNEQMLLSVDKFEYIWKRYKEDFIIYINELETQGEII